MKISCPHCDAVITALPAHAGHVGRCPKCSGSMLVPDEVNDFPVTDSEAHSPPRSSCNHMIRGRRAADRDDIQESTDPAPEELARETRHRSRLFHISTLLCIGTIFAVGAACLVLFRHSLHNSPPATTAAQMPLSQSIEAANVVQVDSSHPPNAPRQTPQDLRALESRIAEYEKEMTLQRHILLHRLSFYEPVSSLIKTAMGRINVSVASEASWAHW